MILDLSLEYNFSTINIRANNVTRSMKNKYRNSLFAPMVCVSKTKIVEDKGIFLKRMDKS